MTKLLASAGSQDQITKMIQGYFFNPLIKLELTPQGHFEVVGAKGVIDGCRVILKGKRFRFEMVSV